MPLRAGQFYPRVARPVAAAISRPGGVDDHLQPCTKRIVNPGGHNSYYGKPTLLIVRYHGVRHRSLALRPLICPASDRIACRIGRHIDRAITRSCIRRMPELHDIAWRDVDVDLHAVALAGRGNAFNRKDMLACLERYVFGFRVDKVAQPRRSSQRGLRDGSAPFFSDKHLNVRPVDHPAQMLSGQADLLCSDRGVLRSAAEDGEDCGLHPLWDAQRLTCALVDELVSVQDVWHVIDALAD